jgi:hypothetical protein
MRGSCLCGAVEFRVEGDFSRSLSVPLLSLSYTRGYVLKFGNHCGREKLQLGHWTRAYLVLRETNRLSFRLL